MPSRLDITAGELSAIVDFALSCPPRYRDEFMKKDLSGCLLCDFTMPVSRSVQAVAHNKHVHSEEHEVHVDEYLKCTSELQLTDRVCFARDNAPVSRRECIVTYLSDRIALSDTVHNVDAFYVAAAAFLMHRISASALANAYCEVRGTERAMHRGLCVACLERPATMMFEECKHVACCMMCSAKLATRADTPSSVPCPVCRVRTSVSTVYLS